MSLYSNHRPQTFQTVAGQQHIITTITNQIAKNKISHAYLFSGPRGIGKTTTARLIAKAVNCTDRKEGSSEPCNKCFSCQSFLDGRSIDIIEIDAASNTKVDSVRENIIENAQFRPTNSLYKVFIIDEVHMLSTSSFNALLKTLEEPPSYVIFVLATTELHKLPDTIVSRCQRFQFRKIDAEEIKNHLKEVATKEKVSIENDVLDRIATKSEGHLRDALSILEQLMSSGDKKITQKTAEIFLPASELQNNINFLSLIIKKDLKSALKELNYLLENGVSPKQLATDLLKLLRIVLVTKSEANWETLGIDFNESSKKEIENLHNIITNKDLVDLTELLLKRRQEINLSPILQLPLEILIVEWCASSETPIQIPEIQENAQTSTTKVEMPIEKPKETQPIPPPQEEKPAPEPEKKQANLTISEVTQKWPVFISKIEEQFPSLVFILKTSEIVSTDDNTITIVVSYSFLKDKLTEKTCLANLLTILKEIFGTNVNLDIQVKEGNKVLEEGNKELEDLANMLGGEIV